MKLYLWTGVLSDYTDGMAFAVANSEEEAYTAIREEMGYSKESFDRMFMRSFEQGLTVYELDQAQAAYCYGGG